MSLVFRTQDCKQANQGWLPLGVKSPLYGDSMAIWDHLPVIEVLAEKSEKWVLFPFDLQGHLP